MLTRNNHKGYLIQRVIYFDQISALEGGTWFSLRKLRVAHLSFKLPPSNNIIYTTGHDEEIWLLLVYFQLNYAIFGKQLTNLI